MSTICNDPTHGISHRLRLEREARQWSLGTVAERSGVSKAMISKIERGEASPTAALLGRLSGAFGLTLSGALTFVEGATLHELSAGDCLALRPPADCLFDNRTPTPCRYLVAVLRQG